MRKIESSGNTDVGDAVELARRGQVAPEGLFHDDPRMIGQARGAKPCDHRREERRAGWRGSAPGCRRSPAPP